MKKLGVLVIGMMALTTTASAQDKVEAEVYADVVTKYFWRGQDLGDAAVQPYLGLSYKGLTLSGWGSYGLVNHGEEEIDLTLSYNLGGFSVGVIDYYCFDKKGYDDCKYFDYRSGKTKHVFEANIGYDFGPLSVQWFTNFAGADGEDVYNGGKRPYSSYVELNAPFNLGGLEWEATVGAVPYKTDYYSDANGFAVTNVSLKATKDIKVTDTFSIPVFAAVNTNPSTQKAYFVFGFTLKP